MAKQLNVDLNVKANTSEAKAQFQELQKSLHQVTTELQQVGNTKINPDNLRAAAGAAQELQRHLINAVNVDTGKLNLNKFNTSLKKSNANINQLSSQLLSAGATGQQAFVKLAQSIAAADRPVMTLSGHLNGFLTTLKNTARWQISSSILHGVLGALQGAYGYAQDLNESLNKIRIVTGYSADKMADFAVEANKAAKALSTTTTEYTKASLIYYQQGLSDKDVKARTDATIKLANVSGQTAEEVSDQLTAVWNNFADGSGNLEYYIDVMAKLGATTASSTKEISTGLEKFAAVAKTVGLSYEYATSALATITATTRQSADIVGTALKTLFARIQDLEIGKTLEDGTTLGKYSKALNAVGVNIKDINGEVKNMDDILDELGAKWSTIAKDQQIALAQTVAGTRQYTQLIALMDNWDFMKKNLDTAAGAQGTLNQQAKIYEESWEASSKRVKASLQGIYDDLLDDKFFIKINNGIASILSGIDSFIKDFGGLKNLVLGFSGILLTHLSGKIKPAIESVKLSLTTMFQTPQQQAMQYKETLDQVIAAGEKQLGMNFTGADKSTQVALENAKGLAVAKNALMIVDKDLTAQERSLAQQQLDMIMSQQEYVQSLADTVTKQQEFCENIESIEPRIQLSSDALKDQEATLAQLTEEYETWLMFAETEPAGSTYQDQASAEAAAAERALELYIDTLDNATGTAEALGDTLMEVFTNAAKDGIKLGEETHDITSSFAEFNTIINRAIQEMEQFGTAGGDVEHAMAGGQASLKAMYQQMSQLGVVSKEQRKLFIQAFSTKDPKRYNDLLKQLDKSMGKIEIQGKNIKSVLSKMGKGKEVAETEKGYAQLHAAQKKCNDEQERLNQAIQNFDPKHLMGGGEAFMKLAGAGMQASMAINGFRSVWEALTSSDMSAGERITQILMGIGMAAPAAVGAIKSVISVAQALQTHLQAMTAATTAYNAAQTVLTTSTTASTAVTELNTLAKNKANDESLKAAANKVAEALAAKGVITAEQTEAMSSRLVAAAKATEGAVTTEVIAQDAAEVASKGAVTGAKAAATAGTWAHVVALIAEKLAMAPLLVVVILLTAALGALALIIWGVVSAVKSFIANSPEGKLKAAEKRAEALAEALEDVKQAADDLKSAFNDYASIRERLDNCTKGTKEWQNALEEVNSKVLELLSNYPELAQYISTDSNGALTISEQGINTMLQAANARQVAAQGAVFASNQDVRQAQIDVDRSKIRLDNSVAQDILNKLIDNTDFSQLSEEKLRSVAKEAFSNDTMASGWSDGIVNNWIDKIVALKDNIVDLQAAIKANTTATEAENQAIASSIVATNEKLQNSEYAKDVTQAAGNIYGETYNDAYKKYKAQASKRGGIFATTKTEEAEKAWNKYVQATGLQVSAVTNYKGDGSIEYKDKEDQTHTVTAEEIAATLAAAEAAEKLAGSCETLIATFSRLDNSTDQAEHALKDFLTSGDFEASSFAEFTEISNKDAATYLAEQFGGEDQKLSAEEAKAFGYESEKAMREAYQKAIDDAREMWGSVNFDKIAISGVKEASLETATKLQQTFDNISLGPQGEAAGQEFVTHLNKMLDGVDTDKQQEALERLSKVDWSSYDAMEDAKKIMAEYGKEIDLTDASWQQFIADMRIASGALPDFSTLKQDLAETAKIIQKLDFGSTISDEDYQKLIEYKDAFKDLFMTQADGTRKFIGNDEDMTQSVRDDIEAKRTQFADRAEKTQAFKDANWHWASGAKQGQTIDFSTVSGTNTALAGSIRDTMQNTGENDATTQFMNMLGYDAESISQIIEQANSSSEDIAKIGQARLLEMYQRMGEAQHEGLTEMSEEFNEMMASTATSYEQLSQMLADGLTSPEAAAKQLDFLATSAINASTSLNELDVAIVKAQEAGATINYDTYANQLINLASQYDNTSFEAARYQEALERAKTSGGEQAQAALGEAEANLRAATAAGEAAKKYGLTAEQIERYAEELKNSGKYEKASKRELVELAKDQLRYDKAVVSAQKNMSKWTKDLKVAGETGHLVAETADEMAEAYGDLLDIDGSELSANFLQDEENLTLMQDALNDVDGAYEKLQAKARADIETRFGINDEEFQTKYADIIGTIDEFNNTELGKLEAGASIDNQDYLDALTEMVNAAGMTAEQATDYLSSMGVDAEVVNEPEQVEETVGYNLTPIIKPRTGNYSPAAGGGEATYSYPQVRYKSTPVKETKTVSGTALKVTSAAKSSGGSVKHTGSTSAHGGSNAGNGGGGGDSDNRQSAKEHKSPKNESERYHVLNEQLEDLSQAYDKASKSKDRLFGANRITAINKEISAIDNLIAHNKTYLKEIGNYREKDKNALLNGGLTKEWVDSDGNLRTFTSTGSGLELHFDDNGNLTNYDKYIEALVTAYNQAVNDYNTVVRTEGVSEDAVKEAEDTFKQAEMQYELAMEALNTYEESNNKFQEKLEEIRDSYREEQDKRFEAWQTQIELQEKMMSNDLRQMDYFRKYLERFAKDNFAPVTELLSYWNNNGSDSNWKLLQIGASDLLTAAEALNEATHGDPIIDEAGNLLTDYQYSEADWADAMEESIDKLYEQIDAIYELDDTMTQYYSETLSNAETQLEQYMTKMEDCTAVLKHFQTISELLGKEADYKWIGDILSAQKTTVQNELQSASREYKLAKAQYDEMLARYELDKDNVSEATRQRMEAELQAQYESMSSWHEKMLSKTEEYAELINAIYENAIKQIGKVFEDAATNGQGWDSMLESMDRVAAYQDLILTRTNQVYETNKLMNKLAQDIDHTDNVAAKTKLANFKREIQDMQNMNEMSKFDLDVANARYEVLKAQIALEEAQNAKSTVRLQRDSEGNYGYVYTADQDKVDSARQAFEDKQNDLYNLTLNKANENARALAELDQEMYAELERISLLYKDDKEKMEEETNRIIEEYAQRRSVLVKDYSTADYWQQQVSVTKTNEAYGNAYKKNLLDTDEWKVSVSEMVTSIGTEYKNWADEMDTYVRPTVGTDLEDLTQNTQDLTTASEDYQTWFDDFADSNADRLKAIAAITNAYMLQRDTIAEVVEQLQNMATQQSATLYGSNLSGNVGYDPDRNYAEEMANWLKKGGSTTDIEYQQLKVAREAKIAGMGLSADYYGARGSKFDTMVQTYADNNLEGTIVDAVNNLAETIEDVTQFDTGGYTGQWGSSGKLAMLHQGELVLNATDTEKFLEALNVVRELSSVIDLRAAASGIITGFNSPMYDAKNQILQQEVTIHAEFPNATNHSEIEQAFDTLINRASQFANRTNHLL